MPKLATATIILHMRIYIYMYNIICTFHAIEGVPIEKDEQKQKRKVRARNERMTQIEKDVEINLPMESYWP